jgi:cleavage stimulation factor subunit 3
MTRLQDSPHDPEGWKRLIDVAETSGDIARIRKAYDAVLKQYPNTAAAQTAYIAHFLDNHATFGEAEELLNKFLRTSPSVDLWRYYLDYVRRVNTGPSTRETVRKAYEFALNHVGQDRDSGSIWAEYIQFLSTAEANTTWETQQKMDALRKVYHRAVQIPLQNVETLWGDLETFETGLSRITAKKFMEDLSPAYVQARTVMRQLTHHLSRLGITPGLYFPSPPSFSPLERSLVGHWKTYLKWEESNPLELDEKDRPVLISRVQGVYRKAVIRMRYYPEIWYVYLWLPASICLSPQVYGTHLDCLRWQARRGAFHPQSRDRG